MDKQRSAKRKGILDRKTIRRLNDLGFCWSLLHRRFHRRDLDELVATAHGFQETTWALQFHRRPGVWIETLNWLKDVRKSKKQGRLDPRYIRQLDRLGFVWEPRKQRQQKFYAALLDYRKQYGDCRVPVKWPQNRRLGALVKECVLPGNIIC